MTFSLLLRSRIRADLLEWYDAERRLLPWRENPRPYWVLLSEFMLQQTQVRTVIPYFSRFVTRWPTIEALATASEEEVLNEWAGLGYYSRARNLRKCAIEAVRAGGLSSDVATLKRLPGVGPYTAGAVASIAFGARAPLVDGNVERVLSRLLNSRLDPRSREGRSLMWRAAEDLLDPTRPGDFNQALMELGATHCTPKKAASCSRCVLSPVCGAYAAKTVNELPQKAQKKPPTPIFGVAGIYERGGQILLGKRPKGLLAKTWEPISTLIDEGVDGEVALRQVFEQRARLRIGVIQPLGVIHHTFSHRRLRLEVFEVQHAEDLEKMGHSWYDALAWESLDSCKRPLSTLAKKTLALYPSEVALVASPTSPYLR